MEVNMENKEESQPQEKEMDASIFYSFENLLIIQDNKTGRLYHVDVGANSFIPLGRKD